MKLPNGYGSVYKQSGKRRKPWVARKTAGWTINEKTKKPKQLYDIIGFYETRKDALNALADFNLNPYDINSAKITFAELFEKYKEKKYEKIAVSSRHAYNAAYDRCSEIHDMRYVDVKLNHMQDCVDSIDDAGWGTRKKVKTLFNQLYEFANKNDIEVKNYAEFIDIGTNDSPAHKVPFTRDEINLVKSNVNTIEYLDTILILLYSGMRVSEMLDLKTVNIDISAGTMRGGNKTFAGIDRLIPIHSIIMPYIKKYYNPDNEYLITYPDGRPISYGNYRDTYWDTSMIALGMKHLPHECRHTFVSLMDSAGANPTVIKRIVGHAGTGITEKVYTHKDIEELKKSIELIK